MLEIGVFIAAPFAALQLADLGADVIKIESSRRRARACVGTVRQRRELAVLALESTQAFRGARFEVGRRQASVPAPRRDGGCRHRESAPRCDARARLVIRRCSRREPADRLRIGVGIRPGRSARGSTGSRHHGPSARRLDEHHGLARTGRRPRSACRSAIWCAASMSRSASWPRCASESAAA